MAKVQLTDLNPDLFNAFSFEQALHRILKYRMKMSIEHYLFYAWISETGMMGADSHILHQ